MRLEGKTALITGGGKRLGKAISLAFAREGADVIIGSRTQSALEEVATEIEAMGRRSLAVVTDLSDPGQSEALINRALQKFDKIDILVNNAGIEGPVADVVDMDHEGWNEVFAINLTGAMLCAKYVLKKSMIPHRTGVIINISSQRGRLGVALRSAYCASKAALISLTQSLAWEVGRYSIRVNSIAPGPVFGERVERVLREAARKMGTSFEEVVDGTRALSPLKRMVKPEEVAAVAVFLASEESGDMTGQTINCTAGAFMS